MTGIPEAASIVAALVAQFLQTRQGTADSVSNAEFREWLESEAVPEILARSEQLLVSMVLLKANQEDRFQEISDRLRDIMRLLSPSTVADAWQSLQDLDRELLSTLLARTVLDDGAHLDIEEFLSSTNKPRDLVRRSARMLEEREWIHVHEFTGKYSMTMRPSGVLFTWEATEPAEFAECQRAVHEQLAAIDGSEYLGAIAEQANVPVPLVTALLEAIESDGGLQLRKYDGPSTEQWLVHNVSESLRREIASSRR